MHIGRMVFAQLTDLLPRRRFQTLVSRYRGDYKNRGFSCYDQMLTMIFAQLTFCDSLGDIEACLSTQPSQFYHRGIAQLYKQGWPLELFLSRFARRRTK